MSPTTCSPTLPRAARAPTQTWHRFLRAWRSVLRSKEGQGGLDELRCGVEGDGAATAIGHDPKRAAGNGAVCVDSHLHRIERIAVTVSEQGRGGDAEHAEAGR